MAGLTGNKFRSFYIFNCIVTD